MMAHSARSRIIFCSARFFLSAYTNTGCKGIPLPRLHEMLQPLETLCDVVRAAGVGKSQGALSANGIEIQARRDRHARLIEDFAGKTPAVVGHVRNISV